MFIRLNERYAAPFVSSSELASLSGAALDAANEALYRVLQRKTVLALAAEADETLSGYCVFSPDMPAETVSPVPGQTQFVVLGADASTQISQLLQQGATLTLLRETTRFD